MLCKISLIVIQLLNSILLILIAVSSGIVHEKGASYPSKKSIQQLRKDLAPTHNAELARIISNPNRLKMFKDSLPQDEQEFECINNLPDLNLQNSLVCSCKDTKTSDNRIPNVVKIQNDLGPPTPAWAKLNDLILKRELNDKVSKLFLINCSLDIGNNALNFDGLGHLTDLYIAGSEYLVLHPKSLFFSSTNVRITIYKITHPIGDTPYNTRDTVVFPSLHSSTSSLTLDGVMLRDFSTDHFIADNVRFERSSRLINTNVTIMNSMIKPSNKASKIVELNSITFHNIKWRGLFKPRYPFIKLTLRTFVKFTDVVLEASDENIINLVAETLIFQHCKIQNWRHSAIRARVKHAIFYDTKLQEPQKHALMHIYALDPKISTLHLINVTLDDPSRGTLVTKFPLVLYQNIFIERCQCDLVQYLLETRQDRSIVQLVRHSTKNLIRTANITNVLDFSLPRHRMETELNDEIFCHPRNDLAYSKDEWIRPKEDCNGEGLENEEKSDNRLLIGVMVGLLLLVSIIAFIVLFGWRRKVVQKINLVSKWQFHAPKEVQVVDEQKEYVRYIAPVEESSTLSEVEIYVDMRHSYAPDIIRDTIPNALRPKPALSFGKSLESLDFESPRGSIIIHEDIDEYE